ncbi:MAG TPA: ABC transporter ATP-binding protein [Chloroflexota bacterium]|nr:ABC transporter ATP-binding protein [Chloroflexota bacterium]
MSPLEQEVALEADHLHRVFGNKVALHDLSLAVPRGQLFGFLGPNGAGKTTAIKILVGLMRPTSGSVRVLGGSPEDPDIRRRVGYLPEHFRFYDWLTIRELLDYHGRLSGLAKSRRIRRIDETLKLVGLAGREQTRLGHCSKGMQQRAGLAQALLHEPDLVLLDEPSSALDPLGRREVRDVMKALKMSGVTVFLNSHLLSEVEMICDNVSIVDQGRVVRSGSLETVVGRTDELRVLVDSVTPELRQRLERVGRILDVSATEVLLAVTDPEAAPRAADVVHALGLRLYGLVPRQPRLEDVFIQLVENGAQSAENEASAKSASANLA